MVALRRNLVDAPDEPIGGIDEIVAPARKEVGLSMRN
jgi:hypothetical protein